MISAVLIDSREPSWVQSLTFGGVPTSVTMLDAGDLQVVTEDGCILVIERKTPNDFLNTLKDDRLFPQLEPLASKRLDEQLNGHQNSWPYLLITGPLIPGQDGKVVTDRQTGWDFRAVQGALLTVQEMGILVYYAASDMDYEAAVIRLAQRSREPLKVLPPRPPTVLGAQGAILTSLPGIGLDKVLPLLEKGGGSVGWCLEFLTDLRSDAKVPGVGEGTKRRIRSTLGLEEGNRIAIVGENEYK